MSGQFVRSIYDDAPCPTWGRVLGWEDADRVVVAWGDAAYAGNPEAEARIELADELAVAPTSGASTAVGAPISSDGAATRAGLVSEAIREAIAAGSREHRAMSGGQS